VLRQRILLQLIHDDLYCFFQLRIVAATDGMRVQIDFHIGSDAVVFHVPVAVGAPKGHARSGNEAAVHELRIIVDADKPAPGAFADQRADFSAAEIPRHGVAARAGELIHDHYLRTKDRAERRVAYLYLPNTSVDGYTNFNRYYFAQIGKEGAVVDERFNGGGQANWYSPDSSEK